MGLYLCVFDKNEEEIDGLEVGSYEDYGHFVDTIIQELEGGKQGSRYPLITLHSDSDGEWSPVECQILVKNLSEIGEAFKLLAPKPYKSKWQAEVANLLVLKNGTLYDSFIDIDGEPLIERLLDLCLKAQDANCPILFQ